LKKYRKLRAVASALQIHRNTLRKDGQLQRLVNPPPKCVNKNEVFLLAHEFFLRDTSSRITTGKKQTRTVRGKKFQIRYLSDSINNLWDIFQAEYSDATISRTMFYRARPFYVLCPKLSDREQCGCIKCCNLQVKTK
jgi:nitric oxide synthase oxygenase domain/subunit